MDHGHHHQHTRSELPQGSHAARLMKRATTASTALASCLVLAKLIAWWQTDSLAMLSSLTDSTFDMLVSILNLVAIRYALKPADDDHRFGHTSIEDIAGLAQYAFITASMLLIILQSFERLANPHPMLHESFGMWVSFIGMLCTIGLVTYQSYVARQTKSLIVSADRLHYVGDIAFNLAVLVSLFGSAHFGLDWIDPVAALVIAASVLWTSRNIGIRAFNNLMDREMPDNEKAEIATILAKFPQIRGIHNMKTRCAGVKPFIQMHVEMPINLSFREAHAIIDQLEMALLEAFPGAEIIIHPDPVE